ncbi:MAG: serine hydroxymethyltransferase, partial [Candidatus Nanopelagicales bacterium]
KNAIPFDPAPPSIASGIRVGTPSVTTQGMKETEMKQIASLIKRAITATSDDETKAVANEVHTLVTKFPAYPEAH